MTVMQCKTGN